MLGGDGSFVFEACVAYVFGEYMGRSADGGEEGEAFPVFFGERVVAIVRGNCGEG